MKSGLKNQQKTISIEDNVDVISHLEKGEKSVDICCNMRLARSSMRTICDNADRIKESTKFSITVNANNLKQGVFVCVARLPQSYRNEPYKKLWM